MARGKMRFQVLVSIHLAALRYYPLSTLEAKTFSCTAAWETTNGAIGNGKLGVVWCSVVPQVAC